MVHAERADTVHVERAGAARVSDPHIPGSKSVIEMRLRPIALALAVAILTSFASVADARAGVEVAFSPCSHEVSFECATLPVPLLRGKQDSGTITLHLMRKLAGSRPSEAGVIALAGGPGQAALPLAGYFASSLAPALAQRDLIVFDQRGTGKSAPLRCAPAHANTLGAFVGQCGRLIGTSRGAYATSESVADIEAIRQALGYKKLVLYGTSYGTKVAEEYAQRYPSNVEALVLDSVVLPGSSSPFARPTFAAIRSALHELCSRRACNGISKAPLAELGELAKRLRRHPVKGVVYDGEGVRRSSTLSETGLLEVLLAGDLNPALRAMLPAAVHAALHKDAAPLLRLALLSNGLAPTIPRGAKHPSPEGVDVALFIDTTCEDTSYPWLRTSGPSRRLKEAKSALAAIPAAAFRPFDRKIALRYSLLPGCAHWPYEASASPPVNAGMPNMPTLILSGAQDLRTPTYNAKRLAAMIPDAQLLVVPYTGHSVLGSDFTGCAQRAVEAFFAGTKVARCNPAADLFSPTPAIPRRLQAVRPIDGISGKRGRTLSAVLETLVDLDRQVIGATLEAERVLPGGASFGGLHSGYAKLTTTTVRLHAFSFVNGVRLNGTFPVSGGKLRSGVVKVAGKAAAAGTVRIGANDRLSGKLGGKRFALNLDHIKVGSAVRLAGEWRGLSNAVYSEAAGLQGLPTASLQYPTRGTLEHLPALSSKPSPAASLQRLH